MNRSIGNCGDANPNGNIALVYKGGCSQDLLVADAYRCTGCNGWFHKDCIFLHFQLEKKHDWGRNEERKQILEELEEEIVSTKEVANNQFDSSKYNEEAMGYNSAIEKCLELVREARGK